MQTSRLSQHARRPRLTWLLAVVLVTALVFAACAPRGRQPGGNSSGYNSTTTTANSTGSDGSTAQNPNVQAVQNADQSIQSALQSLQSAQNDANTNYSSQDTQTVP